MILRAAYYFVVHKRLRALPAQGNDASSGSNDDNRNCWQPHNRLLAGNDLFRRGCDLPGPAYCSRQIPEADQIRKGQDAALRVWHRSDH